MPKEGIHQHKGVSMEQGNEFEKVFWQRGRDQGNGTCMDLLTVLFFDIITKRSQAERQFTVCGIEHGQLLGAEGDGDARQPGRKVMGSIENGHASVVAADVDQRRESRFACVTSETATIALQREVSSKNRLVFSLSVSHHRDFQNWDRVTCRVFWLSVHLTERGRLQTKGDGVKTRRIVHRN